MKHKSPKRDSSRALPSHGGTQGRVQGDQQPTLEVGHVVSGRAKTLHGTDREASNTGKESLGVDHVASGRCNTPWWVDWEASNRGREALGGWLL